MATTAPASTTAESPAAARPLDDLRSLPLPDWKALGEYRDIRYESAEGIAKITICRPEVRNAFRPQTLFELTEAFTIGPRRPRRRRRSSSPARAPTPSARAATSGSGATTATWATTRSAERGIGRLNVLDLQIQIRRLPKPVVARVAGYAIGGGHVLHLVCDLTIAADNARFGQTGPKVGSFDGGYGSGLLARTIGLKRAKEIWFLCRQYDAAAGARLGAGQHGRAARPTSRPRRSRGAGEMLTLSPIALRMLKAGFNAADDGLAGIQQLAGDATMLFYMTEEGQEGRNAYVERRRPDFSRFPRRP